MYLSLQLVNSAIIYMNVLDKGGWPREVTVVAPSKFSYIALALTLALTHTVKYWNDTRLRRGNHEFAKKTPDREMRLHREERLIELVKAP